jgi:hypothetical protein
VHILFLTAVRFQKGKRKPTRYRKKYGKEMMPFSEQIGRGNDNIMPMVCIDGKKDLCCSTLA